jgi:hypothetical protein
MIFFIILFLIKVKLGNRWKNYLFLKFLYILKSIVKKLLWMKLIIKKSINYFNNIGVVKINKIWKRSSLIKQNKILKKFSIIL